jgi:hypothetical protein
MSPEEGTRTAPREPGAFVRAILGISSRRSGSGPPHESGLKCEAALSPSEVRSICEHRPSSAGTWRAGLGGLDHSNESEKHSRQELRVRRITLASSSTSGDGAGRCDSPSAVGRVPRLDLFISSDDDTPLKGLDF